MTIELLKTTLAEALKIPATLYAWRGGNLKVSNLVLSVTGENAYKTDEVNGERLKEVSIDLYIAGSDDTLADSLIDELEKLGLPYRLNTGGFYEPDTNFNHYEFITEI